MHKLEGDTCPVAGAASVNPPKLSSVEQNLYFLLILMDLINCLLRRLAAVLFASPRRSYFNRCRLSICLSFWQQDNCRMSSWMSTKRGSHGKERPDPLEVISMCMYNHFSTSVNRCTIYYMIYSYSPKGATAADVMEFALSEHICCSYYIAASKEYLRINE